MLTSNFAVILNEWIHFRQMKEKNMGYTADSAILAGARETLDAIHRGETVELKGKYNPASGMYE